MLTPSPYNLALLTSESNLTLLKVAQNRPFTIYCCCSCSTPPTWVSLLPVSACHPTSMPTILSFTRGGPPSTVAQQRHRMELGIEWIAEWMRSNRLCLNPEK